MYTTIENIQNVLGRDLTDSEQASFATIDSSIDSYINSQTGTRFGSAEASTIYASGADTAILTVPTMHGDISVKDASGDSITDFMKYPQTGDVFALIRNNNWEKGLGNYAVTAIIGYEGIPDDIKAVATELAANYFSGQQATLSGAKSEKVGDWSITYLDGEKSLSDRSLAVLANYKRLSRSI